MVYFNLPSRNVYGEVDRYAGLTNAKKGCSVGNY
jgi:hypothetical protein